MKIFTRLIAVLTLAFAFLLAPAPAFAADLNLIPACKDNSTAAVCKDIDQQQTQNSNSIYGPKGIIARIANILAIVVGIAAVIVIMIAGIQYMLASGDAAKVGRAKDAILYAVIGLVVTVLARTIVVFVISRIGK